MAKKYVCAECGEKWSTQLDDYCPKCGVRCEARLGYIVDESTPKPKPKRRRSRRTSVTA